MATTLDIVNSGERLSFYQLFTQKKVSIEIPIIQRDYAQGRKSQREVRVKFLDALYSYLDENIPGRDLDFVYGSITEIEGRKMFIPLDGQQRLTTLFLLHWYLSLLGNNKSELQRNLTHEGKSLFTYETRASAREFFDALLHKNIDYSGPQPKQSISKIIQNCGWYFLSWKYDPTIQAILVMLDDIEAKFGKRAEFFERLTDIKNPVITFQFLDLKEFHLTDDLYIKMNSRGKPLSSFENFKAKLEQKIESLFLGDTQIFELKSSSGVRKVGAHHYFSNMIDTVWLHYFWETGGLNPKLVDGHIMNFIRVVLSNSYAVLNNDGNQNNLRILFKSQDAKSDEINISNLTYFDYLNLGTITKPSIITLINCFDILIAISAIKKDNMPDAFHYDHKQILSKASNYELNAQERLRFHALLGYLINHKGDINGLKNWMRVVYNLTENTRIDDADLLQRGLKEIEFLLSHAPNILEWLTNKKNNISVFYGRQVEEERIKAHLINRNSQWKEQIWAVEKDDFFRGQIGFILEFSGILDYYTKNNDCKWSEGDDKKYFDSFCTYSQKASYVFIYLQNTEDDGFLWQRAVLTKGIYLIPASYNRLNFLTISLSERYYSWKRLLRLNNIHESDDPLLTLKRQYVKAVFDDSRFSISDFENSCRKIISDSANDWRSFFIQNPELISICLKGFIRFDDELNIMLLKTSKLTYHYELRTYDLFLKNIQNQSFEPFHDTDYKLGYGDDEYCYILIGTWTFERKEYQVRIYFDDEYGITLFKSKGSKEKVDYSQSIIDLLDSYKFKFDLDEWTGYYKTTKSVDIILKLTNDLCKGLNSLKS